jgi:hypothetical protein
MQGTMPQKLVEGFVSAPLGNEKYSFIHPRQSQNSCIEFM